MTEEIKGISITDYMDIDIHGLTEIIALDNQLIDILQERLEATISNRDYAQKCLDEQLYKMECHEASTHFGDYMNVPFPEVQKNYFASMFGVMLTPDGRVPDESSEVHDDI